jgi:uncharacterized protein (UPF0548 family)
VWSFSKPSEEQIRDALRRQIHEPFSYAAVGATHGEPPEGYDFDHNRIQLGTGEAVFKTACAALVQWQIFPAPWTQIQPARAAIRVGTNVVMLAHVFGLWWLNACRIVYVIEETGSMRRYGFAYGTLPDHIESGEERFTVEWDHDDQVWYDVRAFSRPRYWLVRLSYPLARRVQKRFAVESMASMRQLALRAQGLSASGESP